MRNNGTKRSGRPLQLQQRKCLLFVCCRTKTESLLMACPPLQSDNPITNYRRACRLLSKDRSPGELTLPASAGVAPALNSLFSSPRKPHLMPASRGVFPAHTRLNNTSGTRSSRRCVVLGQTMCVQDTDPPSSSRWSHGATVGLPWT